MKFNHYTKTKQKKSVFGKPSKMQYVGWGSSDLLSKSLCQPRNLIIEVHSLSICVRSLVSTDTLLFSLINALRFTANDLIKCYDTQYLIRLTLNTPRGVLWGPQRVIFCDPTITISTNLLLIFVCVPHQLEINIMGPTSKFLIFYVFLKEHFINLIT